MQEYKIYLASAAFICLTAVKLCFPTIPAQLRQEALDILCSGTDYGSAIQAMGRSLSRGQLDSELVQALEYIKSPSYGQADMIPAGDLSGTVSVYTYPSSKDSYNQTLSAGRKIVFPEQASVDNTSADMPPLPFEYVSPVPVSVSSPFGYREHPVEGEYLFHYGIDLAADEGQAVLAFADGQVSFAGTDEGYGNYCILSHADGFSSLYAHLDSLAVEKGQELEMGQLLGHAGQTGNATGPHLHFELMYHGLYLNPEYYL